MQTKREDNAPAKDTSLIPSGEVDLVPLAITTGGDAVLDFTNNGLFQSAVSGVPLLLLVYCDQIFVEGQAAATTVANNLPRAAGMIHSLAVNGRSRWHFQAVSVNGTIRGKLLYAG